MPVISSTRHFSLIRHIRSYVNMPDSDMELGLGLFKQEYLKKGDFLYTPGRICDHIGYIQEGVVRSFYNLDGNEITRFVLLKDNFVTGLSSFISREPGPENIQAVTDTKLWVISHEDVEKLYAKSLKWLELGKKIIEQSHLKLEKRILALIALTAEERYKTLSIEQPEIIQNVPVQYIASILGVKPETLSRIRRKVTL